MSICKIYSFTFMYISMMFFLLSIFFMIQDYKMIIEYQLISLNSSMIIMIILLDWMSLLFMSFVLFISSMVIYYSEEYMLGDMNLNRFILLVVMFVLSMMLLIISPNLISILLGWDGLGLVSYCLVIYYQNIKSYNAGMLTALSNRIGDVALLLSIAWMLNFGSWSFIYYLDFFKNDKIMEFISLMVILAAMTKSAQIPFSSWLPAAMAAPTPVSSLVHSSTLVTAGVYLLIRFNFVFSENLKMLFLLIAGLTMFMSGLSANFEFDLKKIIALSTLSQLGLMMSILALGSYELAFFHLLIHALFKALLFMCAGSIIHSMNNCQDIRYMGNLINQMPLVCSFFNICNFSLCGLPFLSGFYSKDLIVEVMTMNSLNLLIYFLFYISIGLTVCYSFRLMFYSLIGSLNYLSLHCLMEDKSFMLKGMAGLIFSVVFSGSMLMWLMFPSPYFICLPFIFKIMALIMIMIGMYIGYELAKFKMSYNLKSLDNLSLSMFLAMMWNMPMISTLGVNYYPIYYGNKYLNSFDQGWTEYYGGQNLNKKISFMSKLLQLMSINHLKIFFMLMIFWLMLVMILF
uniref:NADH-ubiquinone oxidoreductase chain 5 n=1 Tax=Anoplophora horsfieldi TaxID=217633 RepID=A0A8A4YRE1_9CUCU|nr:NADH dehydrogenase subunit 5 [Anoplophora horsfieldi]QTE20921.1 NADH dehydrogenase subunit 5 [Anoplophora horsfieldi]